MISSTKHKYPPKIGDIVRVKPLDWFESACTRMVSWDTKEPLYSYLKVAKDLSTIFINVPKEDLWCTDLEMEITYEMYDHGKIDDNAVVYQLRSRNSRKTTNICFCEEMFDKIQGK